jgi:hypothetical protein
LLRNQKIGQGSDQLRAGKWFLQDGALGHTIGGPLVKAIASHIHDGHSSELLAGMMGNFPSVGTIAQSDVRDQPAKVVSPANLHERAFAVGCFKDRVAALLECLDDGEPYQRLIFDN